MLAILVAVSAEERYVRRHLREAERREVGGFPVVVGDGHGRRAALCRTGIGGERARRAAEALLGELSPRAVVALGFAGGAVEGPASGDLVLAESVYLYQAGGDRPDPVRSDARLLRLAEDAARGQGLRYRLGDCATVAELLPAAEQKRAVAAACPVTVVEMESYYVGRVAAAMGVPFLCARVISDAVSETLPVIDGMVVPDGRLRPWQATVPYLLRRPGRAVSLVAWALRLRRAVRTLSAFADGLLTAWAGVATAPGVRG